MYRVVPWYVVGWIKGIEAINIIAAMTTLMTTTTQIMITKVMVIMMMRG